MTKIELINKLESCEINSEKIKRIEDLYKVHLSEIAKKVFSYDADDNFIDDWRVLTTTEILVSKKWMNQDYVGYGVVPLIDVYDLNYIVFIPHEEKWAMVNDGDGIVFNRKSSLREYVEE